MKITFVSPFYSNVWEPLGVAYIIAYCKMHHPDVEYEFVHGNFDSNSTIYKKCLQSDIVAFSATSPTYDEALRIAKVIKHHDRHIRTILGGWHVTSVHRIVNYIDAPNIDHLLIGEGEFMSSVFLTSPLAMNMVIYGIPLDFEKLPWPDREAINQKRHLELCHSMCGLRIASFQSRRGCPMNCAFCGEHNMSVQNLRVRDPNDLLDEIDMVNRNYNIDMFKFVDPTWCHPTQAAYDFCEAKIKRNNNLPWEAMGHAGFLTKDLLKIMSEANCKQINIGVESGSQKILNDIRKGVTISKIKKVFTWCHELGIESRGFFLFGMPNDTLKTADETFELVKEIDPDIFGMTILCPYPGSDFYDPKKHANINWAKADEYSNDFWETKYFTNDDLKRVQRVFARRFKDKLPPHMREVLKIT